MLESGRQIGPYQLQGQLGAGGMGEVYRALDTRMGRMVALKILPESLAGDDERRRRFEQEARLAAALNHPNVMAIYDVGLDQKPPYIVGEFVPGESLRGLIGKGTAKILDFGVARMQAKPAAGSDTVTLAQTSMGSVVGTAAYMSPEQARAEDVDHRSDQFSLGLVLYEMLSAKQAFARPSAIQTMSAIVEDDPPPLERTIPAQLRWILDRCLAKEREGRYESTRDLARELAYLRDHFGEAGSGATTGAQPAVVATRRQARPAVFALWALGGALLAWCLAMLGRDATSVDLSRYKLTPFGTSFSVQSFTAWSPDGKSIAFLGRNESGQLQLFVQGLDAPTPVQLTPAGDSVYSGAPPFWSPDSRSIYYRCSAPGSQAGICRIPAGGGAPTIVQRDVQSAAISPDGKTLAMWLLMPEGGQLSVWTASPPEAQRQRYSPMPFRATQHYNNPALAFAPNGKELMLCVALDTRGENCWTLPWPAGPGRNAFGKALPFGFTPQFTWMPDSRHIVFADSAPGTLARLYMADTNGGATWPILAEDRPVALPSLSPDGSRVAYTSVMSYSEIVAVPVGDGPVRTVMGGARSEQRVETSPVAQQIVYVTNRRGVNEVWIKSLAEGWERPLLTPNDVQPDGEPANDFLNPVFSPDGRRVAVGVKGRSGVHVYTMFSSGGAPVRATSGNDMEFCATWSPDGNWLAFSALAGPLTSLMKVRPGSGEAAVKVADTYGRAAPVWSPDGAWIADHDLKDHLVLVSPDGQQRPRCQATRAPWRGRGIPGLCTRCGCRPRPCSRSNVARGKERKLRDLGDLDPYSAGNPGLSAGLTSDGKEILYSVSRARAEIWILDGIRSPSPWYMRLLGK